MCGYPFRSTGKQSLTTAYSHVISEIACFRRCSIRYIHAADRPFSAGIRAHTYGHESCPASIAARSLAQESSSCARMRAIACSCSNIAQPDGISWDKRCGEASCWKLSNGGSSCGSFVIGPPCVSQAPATCHSAEEGGNECQPEEVCVMNSNHALHSSSECSIPL